MLSHDMFADTLGNQGPGPVLFTCARMSQAARRVCRAVPVLRLAGLPRRKCPAICRRESVMQALRVFYWDIYAIYLNDPQAEKTAYTHKEELAFRFMQNDRRGTFSQQGRGVFRRGSDHSKYLTN